MAYGQAIAAAAVVAASAFSAAQQNQAARTQATLDQASAELNLANTKAASAFNEEAGAINFRRKLASQVAIASMRGGAGSLVRQFGSSSFQNYTRDIRAIRQDVKLAEIEKSNVGVRSRTHLSAVRRQGIANILQSGANAYASSAFGGSGATDTTTLTGPANMANGRWINPNV